MTPEEEECIRHVLYYFGQPGGWSYGGFTESLLTAWQKADPSNRARLTLAFPELGEPMNLALGSMTGIKELQEKLSQHKQ